MSIMEDPRSHHKASINPYQEIRHMHKVSESFDKAKATVNTEICREEAQIRRNLALLQKEKEESKAELCAYKNFMKDQRNTGKEESRRQRTLADVYEHDLEDMLQHCKYHENEKATKDRKENFNDAKNMLSYNRQQRRMTLQHLKDIHEVEESSQTEQPHLPQIPGLASTGRRGSLMRPSLEIPSEERRAPGAAHEQFSNDPTVRRLSVNVSEAPKKRCAYLTNKGNMDREDKEAWLESHNRFGHRRQVGPGNSSMRQFGVHVHPNPAPHDTRMDTIKQYYEARNNTERRRPSLTSDPNGRTDGRRPSIHDVTINANTSNHQLSAPHQEHTSMRRLSIDHHGVPLTKAATRVSQIAAARETDAEHQKYMSRYGGRRQSEYVGSSQTQASGGSSHRHSLFNDSIIDEIQNKSLHAYQDMLSDAYKHPSAKNSTSSVHGSRHQIHPDKYEKLKDVLRNLPSSKVVTLDPMEALHCRYLRLPPGAIDELEQLCLLKGEDPGVHAHMTEQDVLDYYA